MKLNPKDIRLGRGECPRCRQRRWFIRVSAYDWGARCLSCRSSAITLSIIDVIERLAEDQLSGAVYELSARGPLVAYFEARACELSLSQYLEGHPSGEIVNGVRCEDVQSLSWDDACFDLVTSTEVFEHVPDDGAGFREVCRVLRPGGKFVFTVPVNMHAVTVERARINSAGELEHYMEPAFHQDPALGGSDVLVFRDYGVDLPDRLQAAGFTMASLVAPTAKLPWAMSRPVVVATRA